MLAGVDEAGRGCLAGPVISACVILDQNYPISIRHLSVDKTIESLICKPLTGHHRQNRGESRQKSFLKKLVMAPPFFLLFPWSMVLGWKMVLLKTIRHLSSSLTISRFSVSRP